MTEPTAIFLIARYALTPREARIACQFVTTGDQDDDIALACDCGVSSVRAGLNAAYRKVGAASRSALVVEVWRAWTQAAQQEQAA